MSHNIGLLILLALCSLLITEVTKPGSSQAEKSFQEWKVSHGRIYTSKFEDAYRKAIFFKTLEKINKHNSDPSRTWDMGVNQFTDQTPQELAEKYLNKGGRRPDTQIIAPLQTLRSSDELPLQLTPVDWVAMGKVTPVKAQGDCGSCYAFSSVASLESAVLIANRPEQHFSEQQLMECSSNYGNAGCHGGYLSSSFNYMTAKGIATDREYPYSGITWPCQFQGGTQKTKGYVAVSGCQDLYNVLTKIPVSVGVAAAATWFQYKSGVMTTCATSPIDHDVLLVGATDQYWTVKNSWGTGWGESGFIRLALGGTCGICTAAAYVVIL